MLELHHHLSLTPIYVEMFFLIMVISIKFNLASLKEISLIPLLLWVLINSIREIRKYLKKTENIKYIESEK